jgi:pimeloyl-[acyl-carrier protein] methyl ester esterase
MQIEKILILPGVDGTGRLLLAFMDALPGLLHREIAIYPKDALLSYGQLASLVRENCKNSSPFVLLAESFSTPLAIRIAAENPSNLKGLLLCTGFARSPLRGIQRLFARSLSPLLMQLPMPETAIRMWLAGRDAPSSLIIAVRETIASVRTAVLSSRLRAICDCDVREDLGKIEAPIFYLQARHDRLVGAHCLEEIRNIRPDVRAAVLDGPHFLLQREPHKAAQIVTHWIEELP